MNKIRNTLTLFAYLISVCVCAQDNTLDYQISSRQLSPQAYEFARYGNTPVKYFTGEVDFSIPLYIYQDRDFKIPITLKYNGNGFKPNKNEGMIGLDWALNLGGAITRCVQGVPDEIGDRNTEGVMVAHNAGVYNYDVSFNEKIENTSIPDLANAIPADYIAHWNRNTSGLNYGDLSPDEFNFCMPGHSGKFYIGWDGIVQVAGDQPYQVVFSNLFATESSAIGRYITITSPDGYRYVFGGLAEAEETSTYFPDQTNILNQKTIRTAWFLRKIIAPNQREVEFVYRPLVTPNVGYNYNYVYSNGDQSLLLIQNMVSILGGSPELTARNMETGPLLSLNDENYLTYELVRQSSLDKIIVDGKTIAQFNYKEKDKTFYADDVILPPIYRVFNKKNVQMTGIDISYDDAILKKISFEQEYLGNLNNSRFLLTGLTCGEKNILLIITIWTRCPDLV